MKCPHCRVELRLVDRPNRQCSKCKKAIALEPREDPLGLSDLRLRALAEKLSDQGKLFYTSTQLFYHANRKRIDAQPQLKSNLPGCLILSGIGAGAVLGALINSISGVFGGIALGLLVGFIFYRSFGRYLAPQITLSGDLVIFQRWIPERWRIVYGAEPVGWLNMQTKTGLTNLQPTAQTVHAILVCPQPDILVCLRANGVVDALALALLPLAETPLAVADQSLLALLRSQPALPVFLLHDASIDGCLFAQKARQRLGLSDQHRIINLGLHPRQAMRDNLMRLRSPADSEKLAQLKALVNPAHHGAGGQGAQLSALGQLTPAEYEWLAQGYYTPLLSITPKRLLKTVTQGVLAATPVAATQRQIGFMDWPEPQGVA